MFLTLLFVFGILESAYAIVKDCDTSSIFRPLQLELTPDPPISGKPVTLKLIFNNTGPQIDYGSVYTTLSINYIPFTPSSEPLCDDTTCPIIPGINDRSTTTTFPSVTGLIKSKVTWTGPQGESLLCIDTTIKVSSGDSWKLFGLLKNILKNTKKEISTLYNIFWTNKANIDTSNTISQSFEKVYKDNEQEVQTLYKRIENLAKNGKIHEIIKEVKDDSTKIPGAGQEMA
jgi:hypothetical protein